MSQDKKGSPFITDNFSDSQGLSFGTNTAFKVPNGNVHKDFFVLIVQSGSVKINREEKVDGETISKCIESLTGGQYTKVKSNDILVALSPSVASLTRIAMVKDPSEVSGLVKILGG